MGGAGSRSGRGKGEGQRLENPSERGSGEEGRHSNWPGLRALGSLARHHHSTVGGGHGRLLPHNPGFPRARGGS